MLVFSYPPTMPRIGTLRLDIEGAADRHKLRTFPDPSKYAHQPYLESDVVIRFINIMCVLDKRNGYDNNGLSQSIKEEDCL